MAVGRILGVRKTFAAASVGMLEFESDASEGLLAKEKAYKDGFKNRPVNLRKYLWNSDSKLSIVSSSPKVFAGINEADFGEEFYIHEDELDSYCQGFAESIIANIEDVYNEGIEADLEEDNLLESALDDTDIKLSLYRSFKSLYDKWVSNSKTSDGVVTSGYFYNNYSADDESEDSRSLYQHFRFINRANEDIGGKAVIDIAYLSNLSNTSNGQGPTQSLYNSLTNLLSKNNFDFWPLPSDTPLYLTSLKDEDIKDMFRANDFVVDTKNGPMFNCVHIGGSSRTVADISGSGRLACKTLSINKYKDDSFDIGEPTETPKEFLNPDKGVVSFKVRYGQEAQNHFQTLDIDQTEFKETQESLQIIDALTNPKTGSNPSQIGKGNSMYDVYLTRSYNCSVKGLGNMSIQPLMYFTLENVPMFRGTYLITGVKHEVKPHNHTTTFTGMRQPKITVPLVTDALSILDLALTPDEAFEGDRINLSGTYGNNLDGGGFGDTSKLRHAKACELVPPAGNVLDSSGLGGDFSGLKPLKDLLGILESGNKYDIANTPNKISTTSIINLTYDQLRTYSNLPSSDQSRVFAAGRYQVIPKTMKGITSRSQWTYNFGPGKSGVYDKKIQEKFGEYLILSTRKGLYKYIKGENDGNRQDLEAAIQSTSQEWASIPTIKDKNGSIVGSLDCPTCNRAYYVGTPPNKDYTRVSIGTIANTLIKSRIQYSGKKPSYITPSYNNGNPQECKGGETQTNNLGSNGDMGCDKGFVPFGLKGKSDNILEAKNVIVGSSTVGTLSRVKTSSGTLVSNEIYTYYNCGGKTRSWLQGKISTDQNKYPKVKSFFMVGIGTNDGYKVSSSIRGKVKEFTMLIQQKFPNAKLYVFPGTYGWGYRKDDTLDNLEKYYKMYTDNDWQLIWPESGGTRMDPKFSTSELAHNKDGEWFKKQVKLISQNKS